MDQSLNYTEMPSKEQVANDLDGFVMKKPRFNGRIKIGKTFLETIIPSPGVRIEPRYSRSEKYEFLTVGHIFARCSDEKMALEVEKMAQAHAKEKGWLILGSDTGEGSLTSGKDYNFVVYVTQKRPKADRCNFCSKYMAEGKKKHLQKFHIGSVEVWEKKRAVIMSKNLHETTPEGKEVVERATNMLAWWDDGKFGPVELSDDSDDE
jgi:hypothetical protein